MKRSWMLLLLLAAGTAAAADDATQKVIECMRGSVPPHLTVGAFELTSYDRVGGARTLKGRLFTTRKNVEARGGLMHASLRIDAPAEFKGAAYLVQETEDYLRDGMFVYLPAVRRVRRVTGSFADGSLMGTNFSYFDFKQLQHAFGDLTGRMEDKPEHINGRPAHVIDFKAVPGAETKYTSVRAWVDQEACLVMRAEFYEGKKLSKELSSPPGSLKQTGAFRYVEQYEMRDPTAGTRTILKIAKVDPGPEPSARYFDPTAFFMGP